MHARAVELLYLSLRTQSSARQWVPKDCLLPWVLCAASCRKAVAGNAGDISQLWARREVG